MRTTKELLEILKDNLSIIGNSCSGLCFLAGDLHWRYVISLEEYVVLRSYIKNNRPGRFSSIAALLCYTSPFFWPRGWKYPRRRWLKKQINKL